MPLILLYIQYSFNAQHVSVVNMTIFWSLRLTGCYFMGGIWFGVCWRSVSVWLWRCGVFMQSEQCFLDVPIRVKYFYFGGDMANQRNREVRTDDKRAISVGVARVWITIFVPCLIFSPCPKATVCFSPEGDCAVPIISVIDQSKKNLSQFKNIHLLLEQLQSL